MKDLDEKTKAWLAVRKEGGQDHQSGYGQSDLRVWASH